MNRQLIDYLPPVLQSVREFREINSANEPEIKAAWEALDLVLSNQFLESATVEGVRRWEEELGIIPTAAETLDARKARIKILWTASLAYTFPWLIQWLATLSGQACATIEDYTLHLTLPSTIDYMTVVKVIKDYIPAVIALDPKIRLKDIISKFYTGQVFIRSAISHAKMQTDNIPKWVFFTDENNRMLCDDGDNLLYMEDN